MTRQDSQLIMDDKKELDALNIDFFRECFGNHSTTSPVCPFCALGLDCQRSAGNKRLSKQVHNSLASPDIYKALEKMRLPEQGA